MVLRGYAQDDVLYCRIKRRILYYTHHAIHQTRTASHEAKRIKDNRTASAISTIALPTPAENSGSFFFLPARSSPYSRSWGSGECRRVDCGNPCDPLWAAQNNFPLRPCCIRYAFVEKARYLIPLAPGNRMFFSPLLGGCIFFISSIRRASRSGRASRGRAGDSSDFSCPTHCRTWLDFGVRCSCSSQLLLAHFSW